MEKKESKKPLSYPKGLTLSYGDTNTRWKWQENIHQTNTFIFLPQRNINYLGVSPLTQCALMSLHLWGNRSSRGWWNRQNPGTCWRAGEATPGWTVTNKGHIALGETPPEITAETIWGGSQKCGCCWLFPKTSVNPAPDFFFLLSFTDIELVCKKNCTSIMYTICIQLM